MAPAKMAIDGKSTFSSGKGTEEGGGLGLEESEKNIDWQTAEPQRPLIHYFY